MNPTEAWVILGALAFTSFGGVHLLCYMGNQFFKITEEHVVKFLAWVFGAALTLFVLAMCVVLVHAAIWGTWKDYDPDPYEDQP